MHLIQRRKRWYKKPKVDPTNPNKFDEHTYCKNHPWHFNTRNRDRPSGHTPSHRRNKYDQRIGRYRFMRNHRFFILEGLGDL